jgi:hypothetical protein
MAYFASAASNGSPGQLECDSAELTGAIVGFWPVTTHFKTTTGNEWARWWHSDL